MGNRPEGPTRKAEEEEEKKKKNGNIDIKWRRIFNFTSRIFYPSRKNVWYQQDKRLAGPQSKYGCLRERKNLYPSQKPNPDSLVVQPIL
jgi:hypothetical protein